jgi:predicted alpha/beta hydrolase
MGIENIENGMEFPPFNIPVKKFRTGRPRGAAIVLPAMGTRADFYTPLAEELAGRGFAVALPELPGTGASLPRPSRRVDYGYRDLVGNFLPALVELARSDYPSTPIAVIGHSLGAHAGTLAAATGRIEVEALVTVAGGNIHYRNWIGAGALKRRRTEGAVRIAPFFCARRAAGLFTRAVLRLRRPPGEDADPRMGPDHPDRKLFSHS